MTRLSDLLGKRAGESCAHGRATGGLTRPFVLNAIQNGKRQLEKEKSNMAKFYIVQKSNWLNARWQPAAGPFLSRSAANRHPKAKGKNPTTMNGGIDIKGQVHAKVVSRSWLSRNGYPATPEGESRLAKGLR